MRKISKMLILGLFFGPGLPLNFSVKIKCLPISGHCFFHKELISNIQGKMELVDNVKRELSELDKASLTHLEAEFKDYKELYPHEQ